jgi:hypothetical protein
MIKDRKKKEKTRPQPRRGENVLFLTAIFFRPRAEAAKAAALGQAGDEAIDSRQPIVPADPTPALLLRRLPKFPPPWDLGQRGGGRQPWPKTDGGWNWLAPRCLRPAASRPPR